MTKLYFHAVASSLANLPTATKSATVSDKDAEAQTVNRSMDTIKGTAQKSIALASLANTASNDYYFTKFVSDPLKGITSITAQTWNYAYAVTESNVSANFPVSGANLSCPAVAYVWRPSTQTKVGNIADAVNACSTTFSEPASANTITSEYGTFAGSLVSSVQDGDVIVFEFWARTTQATTTSRNCTIYYDGTTETNSTGTTVSNHAAFVETPQTLTFFLIKKLAENITATGTVSAGRNIPGSPTNVNAIKTTLTLDATTGVHDQAFTGFGFQPKGAIFWGVLTTNQNYADGASYFYGFSDGTNSCAVSCSRQDNVGTMDSNTLFRNDACISFIDAVGTHLELVRGKVKTFDSDGLTITWNVKTAATQYIIHVIAFGGSSITNVKVAQTTIGSAGTGNIAYTGVGFQPDFLAFLSGGNISLNTVSANAILTVGAATDSPAGKQFVQFVEEQDNTLANNSNVSMDQLVQRVLASYPFGSATANLDASLASRDSDGFTLNYTTNIGATYPFAYLAVKGGGWDVGSSSTLYTVPAATGTQQLNSKWDEILLAGMIHLDSQTSINLGSISSSGTTPIQFNVGGTDGTNEGCISAGMMFQVTPTPEEMISLTSKVIRAVNANATASSSTTLAEADGNSFFGNSWRLTWSSTNANVAGDCYGWWTLGKSPGSSAQNLTKAVPTQTITVSDSRTRLVANSRAPATQTIVVGETAARKVANNRGPATQTVTVAEASLVRIKGIVRPPGTQTVTVTDAITKQSTKTRSPATQTVTVSESLARLSAKIRALATQTITVAEALTKQSAKKRAPTETITVSESLTRRATKSKALPTQSITVSESLAKIKGLVKTLTQSITVSESPTRLATKIRALPTQTITVADFLTRLVIKTKALPTQTVTVSESPTRLKAANRAPATQTIVVSDTITRLKAVIKAISQNITVGDSLARLAAKIRIPDQIIYDDFEAGTYSFTSGGNSPNGKWTNMFMGGTGASSGVRFSSSTNSNVMWLIPQASITAGESHATENKSASTWADFDLTYRVRTVQQLRTGSAPNSWETAWLIFRYTDDWHHYYFTIKTTGIEFGRKDYFPHVEQQMFLFTSSSVTATMGRWYTVRIRAVSNRFTIWIDGIQRVNMTDNGTTGFDSQTSGLPPPPTPAMYSGSINTYSEDAEVEFDDFVTLAVPTVAVSDAIARTVVHAGGTNITRAVPTQTITVTDAIIRRITKIRALAVQTITVSDILNRLATKSKALPTQTVAVSESLVRSKGLVRALATQTVTVADSIVRKIAKIRAPAVQTVVVSDSITRLATKIRALPTQVVTVSEVIARTVVHGANNITRAVPTEIVAVSDILTRKTVKIRASPTQIVTVTDAIIKITGKARALPTQTVTISDAIARTVGYGLNLVRALTGNIVVGESLARRTTKTRAIPTQTVGISEILAKSLGRTRALAIQTVTIGELLTKRLAKTRVIFQIVSIVQQEIKIFKNGILVVPIQRPDKGGWFYKPPRIKQILYPVYIPTERERLKRRQKLRQYPPLVVIPAFKYNINTVVAPFVVTNPITQTVYVRFAIAPSKNKQNIITYTGKTIPILIPTKQLQKRLNKARCASFIANQQALEQYGRKLNRLSKVMTLWSMAQRLFTSHD